MIIQTFEAPLRSFTPPYKPPFTVVGGPIDKEAAKHKISVVEFNRRNEIIRTRFNECPIKLNLFYLPAHSEPAKQYGKCKVRSIVRSMWEWPIGDKWPQDDEPMIITVEPSNQIGLIVCSTTWLNPIPVLENDKDAC
jgi:hypothetical protein